MIIHGIRRYNRIAFKKYGAFATLTWALLFIGIVIYLYGAVTGLAYDLGGVDLAISNPFTSDRSSDYDTGQQGFTLALFGMFLITTSGLYFTIITLKLVLMKRPLREALKEAEERLNEPK